MKYYSKIPNIFKFDAERKIVGINDPFIDLMNIIYIGTEKIDGTSIVVHWDGYSFEIGGHTSKSQIPSKLMDTLNNIFMQKEMEYLFEQEFGEKEVFIYGEGYGAGIQKGGGLYSQENKFIVFDITIDGFELNRANVNDVCKKLGLESVPSIFVGNLQEAINYVKSKPFSEISESEKEMEGIVLSPFCDIYDRNGHRLRCKCKVRDIEKL